MLRAYPNSSVSGKLEHAEVVIFDFSSVERPDADDDVDVVAVDAGVVLLAPDGAAHRLGDRVGRTGTVEEDKGRISK